MKRLQPLAPLSSSRPGTATLPPLLGDAAGLGRSSPLSIVSASLRSTPLPAVTTPRSARSPPTADASPSPSLPIGRAAKATEGEEKEPHRLHLHRSASSSSGQSSPRSPSAPSPFILPPSPRVRKSPALTPLSPSSTGRGLPPLITSAQPPPHIGDTSVASSSPRRRVKGRKKKQPTRADDAPASPQPPQQSVGTERDDVKEAEGEPATPSIAAASASSLSSVESSDSDSDGANATAPPLSDNATFAATAPASSLPALTPSEDSSFAATQPLTVPTLPPPTLPLPLPYSPPTRPSSLSLSVYVGTWNLHGQPPPPSSSLSHFLPSHAQHDLVVIGSEECDMSIERAVLMSPVNGGRKDRWVRRVWEELGVAEYEKVEEEGMVAMHVVAFMRKRLMHLVSGVERGRVATGVGDVLGNKGGVAISLSVGSTSLLFVNSHFAAHQHRVEERNADFHKVNSRLTLRSRAGASTTSSSSASTAPLVCNRFDRVFWLGDLNYRIEGSYGLVTHLIRTDVMEPLLHNDQLRQQREAGRVFAGFFERDIRFRPTYKVDPQGQPYKEGAHSQPVVYDSSKKKRVPGWTDRVLWKDVEGGGGVECVEYDSVEQVRSSDHFPVKAVFNVRVDGVVEQAVEETKEPPQSQAAEERKSTADTASPVPVEEQEQGAQTGQEESKERKGKKGRAGASGKKEKQQNPIKAAEEVEEPVSAAGRRSLSVSTQTDADEARITRRARGSLIDMAIADEPEDAVGREGREAAVAAAAGVSRNSAVALECQPLSTEKDSQVCVIQ